MRPATKTASLSLILLGLATAAHAQDAKLDAPLFDSGRLLLTQGVSNVEGAAGGGLATWAVISGYGTRDSFGGNVHATNVDLKNYDLRSYGGSVGLWDRVELSYDQQQFDTGVTGAALGLGKGFVFKQDIYGVKVKLIGDAVYDQDSWIPQVAVGAQIKRSNQPGVDAFLGAKSNTGTDYYVAATKVLLNESLVLDATVRMTKANQIGILGFGGPNSDSYKAEFEGSAGYLITRKLVVGAEYRTRPDNLAFAKEDNAWDVFAAYALNKHVSLTAAYVDLGSIATLPNQRGLYLSLQAGF